MRADKLKKDPARDMRLMSDWSSIAAKYQRALKNNPQARDERMISFRWLLEELRVALFAQELRTPMPVSVKRLEKIWLSMQ